MIGKCRSSFCTARILARLTLPLGSPWAATFGNHDAQDGTSKTEQMAALQQMPYSLCQTGPRSVDGVGNYLLKIYAHDASKIHLASVYVLDSGDYVKDSSSWNPFSTLEYDYIRVRRSSVQLTEDNSSLTYSLSPSRIPKPNGTLARRLRLSLCNDRLFRTGQMISAVSGNLASDRERPGLRDKRATPPTSRFASRTPLPFFTSR